MNPAQIELKLTLDQLDVPVELETFSQRFNVQKKVYLTQVYGVDLGYRFGWYLRGPYCQELTADAFALRDEVREGDREYEQYDLQPEAAQRFDQVKQLFDVPTNCHLSSDEWLELLASLHYLRHIVYQPKNQPRDFTSAFDLLIQSKPHFSGKREQALAAWRHLKDIGLIGAKALAPPLE